MKFLKTVVLPVVANINGEDVDDLEVVFDEGTECSVTILNSTNSTFDLEFDDGKVAYSVPKEFVEI